MQGVSLSGDADLRPAAAIFGHNHVPDLLQRQLFRQGDCSECRGGLRRILADRDSVRLEYGFLDCHEELETVLAESAAAYILDPVEPELCRVSLPRFQLSVLRDEFYHASGQPSGAAFHGWCERQDAFLEVASGLHVRYAGRKFNLYRRLVRDDSSGVGFDESGEFRTLCGTSAESAA